MPRLPSRPEMPGAYSPDLEIDHDGVVKAVRDIDKGEVISVPMHLVQRIATQHPS